MGRPLLSISILIVLAALILLLVVRALRRREVQHRGPIDFIGMYSQERLNTIEEEYKVVYGPAGAILYMGPLAMGGNPYSLIGPPRGEWALVIHARLTLPTAEEGGVWLGSSTLVECALDTTRVRCFVEPETVEGFAPGSEGFARITFAGPHRHFPTVRPGTTLALFARLPYNHPAANPDRNSPHARAEVVKFLTDPASP